MYILIAALSYRSKVLDRRTARSLTLIVDLMSPIRAYILQRWSFPSYKTAEQLAKTPLRI